MLEFKEHNMDDSIKARMVARAGGLVFVLVQYWNDNGHRKVLLSIYREGKPENPVDYIHDSFAAGVQFAKAFYAENVA